MWIECILFKGYYEKKIKLLFVGIDEFKLKV